MTLYARSSQLLRRGLQRASTTSQRRTMAGGHYMTVSENHKLAGEVFGVICWLWVFHRARHDLPVLLGFRHPWEHAEDPFAPHVHAKHPNEKKAMKTAWDSFSGKAVRMTDDDDEDEEDEEEEDDE